MDTLNEKDQAFPFSILLSSTDNINPSPKTFLVHQLSNYLHFYTITYLPIVIFIHISVNYNRNSPQLIISDYLIVIKSYAR